MADVRMTLPQAAQSNDVTGALQQLLMSRIPTPEQEQWQKQARTDTMEDYQAELRQPAYGPDYTPTLHGLYSMIDNYAPGRPTGYAALKGIAAGGGMLAHQAELAQKGQTAAAKVAYDNAKEEDKLGDLTNIAALRGLMPKGGGAGSFIQFKDDNGNLYIMNKATGQREMVPATHSKLWGDAYKLAFEKATAEGREDAADFATNMANYTVRQMPGGITTVDTVQKPTRPAGATGPITPGVPTIEPSAVPGSPDNSRAGRNGIPSGRASESDRQFILQQEYDDAGKIIEQYAGNPTHPAYQQALRNQAQIKREMKTVDVNKAPPVEAPPMTYKDKRQEEQNKGYGSDEGKGLYKEYQELGQLQTQGANMLGQLNILKKIYADPSLPEGALAPYIHSAQSGLKSLGINVDKSVGVADLANAVATNMSLAQRTAGGQNLMPGSMTTFEEKLLMNMAPTLGLTSDGRKALVDYMILVNQSNMRLAEEAHLLAKDNKQQLPASWPQRKERVIREEMIKLQHAHDQLMKMYGDKK